MRIEEHIFIPIPKSARCRSGKCKGVWVRRAVLRKLWDIRCRILKETGEDIFCIRVHEGAVEMRLDGDIEGMAAE